MMETSGITEVNDTSEISRSQGSTKNTLEQLNISYWRSVIDMALDSGQDEREWCRVNGVALNTYEKYRKMLESEPAVQPEQDKQKKVIRGKDRSRYVEITRDGRPASIEGTDACGDSIRKPDYRSRYTTASVDEGRSCREPEMVIECGKSRIYIYAGIPELMLHSVVKAVMTNA